MCRHHFLQAENVTDVVFLRMKRRRFSSQFMAEQLPQNILP